MMKHPQGHRIRMPLLVAVALAAAALSAPATAAAAEPPPDLLGPDNFWAHRVTPGPGVLLTWDPLNDPTHYVHLTRSEGCPIDAYYMPRSIDVTLPPGTTSYADDDVEWDRSYVYSVSVVDPVTGLSNMPAEWGLTLTPASGWVHRFLNRRTGTHLYTADETERERVISRLSGDFAYEGPVFPAMYADEHATPLYRFYSPVTGAHFYTAETRERDRVISQLGHLYAYEGIAFLVLDYPDFGFLVGFTPYPFEPAYRYYDPVRGLHLLVPHLEHFGVVGPWRDDGHWAFFVPK